VSITRRRTAPPSATLKDFPEYRRSFHIPGPAKPGRRPIKDLDDHGCAHHAETGGGTMTDDAEAFNVTVAIDPDHHRGTLDRRLFGTFVEHMGRGVYTGIFEPDHPTADEHGFRGDVAALVDELGVTLVRYPGGNFVSGYRWEDGVGPVENRPARLDLAWRAIEPNTVGTDEFLRWAARRGLIPMMAVNLGTRGIQEAADLVEYCNVPGGTAWSDARRANGHPEPYGVPLWCLGNELDGPWQIGHKDAETYGRLAAEAGKAMKLVDPAIELVACGSSGRNIPTFGTWESTVLEHAYDVVDYISLHAYYEEHDGDRRSFLASGADMAGFIADVVATADAVGARKHSRKRIGLSFDEWNVWYISRFPPSDELPIGAVGTPRIEDVYSTLDAVVVGDLLITLINASDRVAIGCLAQLVNVIAPIRTEPGGAVWRQTTFYPIAETARAAKGLSLVAAVHGPTVATARHGDVPAVSAAATHAPGSAEIAVFLVNRADRPADVTVRHAAFPGPVSAHACHIRADSAGPRAGADQAATARPGPLPARPNADGTCELRLPPESWTLLRLATGQAGPATGRDH
jgi:alpha-L-arabinofuranosidase